MGRGCTITLRGRGDKGQTTVHKPAPSLAEEILSSRERQLLPQVHTAGHRFRFAPRQPFSPTSQLAGCCPAGWFPNMELLAHREVSRKRGPFPFDLLVKFCQEPPTANKLFILLDSFDKYQTQPIRVLICKAGIMGTLPIS